ncbi:MAG: P-II family nitrogen regulator [Firmicutes bacterium]|jgi:nitrogen regulatory protein PII|nr:P-II family nitrogen regulator [Bacillota bacterium]
MSVKVNNSKKIIFTIVRKGKAARIVKASREAGAEGGTVVFGLGTGKDETEEFLGVTLEPEKEMIITLIAEQKLDDVLSAIGRTGRLNEKGRGIAFVIDASRTAGIVHRSVTGMEGGSRRTMEQECSYDLIVTIVNKGDSEKVVEASRNSGAEGGTILSGRGTGIHEQAKLFGLTIEPEKELVLTLIKNELTSRVLEAIVDEIQLNRPGKGIAFVIKVERVVGISHLMETDAGKQG